MVQSRRAKSGLDAGAEALAAYVADSSNWERVLPAAIGALGALLMVALFWPNPPFLATLLVALSLIMLWRARPVDWGAYGVCAIMGTLAEIAGVGTGGWEYVQTTAWGVPVWLPFLWGIAYLAMVQVGREFARLGAHMKVG